MKKKFAIMANFFLKNGIFFIVFIFCNKVVITFNSFMIYYHFVNNIVVVECTVETMTKKNNVNIKDENNRGMEDDLAPD